MKVVGPARRAMEEWRERRVMRDEAEDQETDDFLVAMRHPIPEERIPANPRQ